MFKSPHSLSRLVVFLISGSFSSFASVTVGGITFDSAVVNDNALQATPADYSCTQTGPRIISILLQ